jgi:hypothetical protein
MAPERAYAKIFQTIAAVINEENFIRYTIAGMVGI